jgi:uncharacterized membrane protein
MPMDHTERSGHPRRSEEAEAIDAIEDLDRELPIWGPELVVAVAIALAFLLPTKLTIGPRWLLPSVEALLLLGLIMASPRPRIRPSRERRWVAIALIALVSVTNIVSLTLLCHFLLRGGQENGRVLIYSGALLYITNVLLFGLWYWELDRGGPAARMRKHDRARPDFLFPQMTDERWAPKGWLPGLGDYLYVSLTNATAFSPTDTMPLTQTAKALMSAQAMVSLVTIGLVVARAVNILN